MREMLEPLFGSSGAVIAQFVITLAVVLALVAVVAWLVRRYAAGGLGTTVRGRLPRLAVLDALAVDNRRRLVLVRRDNVEHLLLIGGPADLVVEPGIVRARAVAQRQPPRPAAAPAESAAEASEAAPAAPVVQPAPAPARAEPAAERPIPFPPRRTERNIARRDPRQVVPAREAEEVSTWQSLRNVLSGPREEARVTPFVPVPPAAEAPTEPAAEPPFEAPVEEAVQVAAEMVPEPAAAEQPEGPRVAPGGDEEVELPSFLSPAAQAAEEPPVAEEQPPPLAAEVADAEEPAPADSAARVNDLEREMARLLGEISARRTS